jgi:hypothetical protein
VTPPVGKGRLLRSSAFAQDVEVVAVVHDAQDVAERVGDRGGDKAWAALGDCLELMARKIGNCLGAVTDHAQDTVADLRLRAWSG